MDDSPAAFSIDRALRVGWDGFRPNAASLAPLAGAMVVVGASFRWLAFQAEALALAVLFDVIGLILSSMLLLLLAFAALAIVDDRPLDFTAYLASGLFRTQAVASIIFWVTTLLGILLLLIPGIFIMLTYCLYTFVIADQPTTPLRSLLESSELTRGRRWLVLGLGVAFLVVNALGVAALLIGVTVTVPVSVIAGAYTYRHFQALSRVS